MNKRFLKHFIFSSMICLAAFSQAAIVDGDVIKLDFSDTGDGDGGSINDWNQWADTSSITTVKRHGDASTVAGVHITFANFIDGHHSNVGRANNWPAMASDPYYIGAANDIYYHGNESVPTITFSGLDENLSYSVRVYSIISGEDDKSDTTTVTDGASTVSSTSSRGVRFSAASLEAAGTVFTHLHTDGAGNIVVQWDPITNAYGPLNAVVLEAHPPYIAPTGISGGDVIKVDFSTTGDSDGMDATDWNQWADTASITNVKRHSDAEIIPNVRITFSNFRENAFNNEPAAANWPGTAADPYYEAGADDIYYHSSVGAAVTTFSGLDDGLTYNARIYCLTSEQGAYEDSFSVTDGTGTQDFSNTRAVRWGAATLEEGGTVFSDLATDGAGNIRVSWDPTTASSGPLNAIVLEANADPNFPQIDVLSATNVLGTSGWLNADLVSTGTAATAVTFYWGTADAGITDDSAWENSIELGFMPEGPVSTKLSNLPLNQEIFYRCAASNSYGTIWSGLSTFIPSFPTLSIADIQMAEGNSGTVAIEVTINLSTPYPEAISFSYSTADGKAMAGTDYEAISGSASFAPGATTVTLSINVFGDTVQEAEEFFHLQITPTSTTIPNVQSTVFLFDDDRDGYLSPEALAVDESAMLLYVAQATGNRIDVIDLTTETPQNNLVLPQPPNGLTLSADGATLYVTAGMEEGNLYVIDTATLQITATISVGHSPRSPLLVSANTLYVCNQFNHDVSVVDLINQTETARIPVEREPFASAKEPDGSTVLVANLLPNMPSTAAHVAAAVSIIDSISGAVTKTIELAPGSHSLRDIAFSTDGRAAVVTHVLSRYRVPTTQVTRGWINTAALSIIDMSSQTLLNTILLDDLDEGAANPWGVAFTSDGESICVAHAGTHELSIINWTALKNKLGSYRTDASADLTFLAGLRRRLPLGGNGPRELVLVGNMAYISQYFSETIAIVDVAETAAQADELAIAWTRPLDLIREGEQNFNDATLCMQHWQSCISCHPGVRADALNWDNLNDGFGNPKNTKSLILAHQTPPTTFTGIRPNAEVSVIAGLRYIHFSDHINGENLAIDEYLKSLEPLPSPYLVDGQLSPEALRGQALFTSSSCIHCHSGSNFTDLRLHDVGTGTGNETGTRFDTPSLRESWRTAPYLYDGRAATIRDVLTTFNTGDQHGFTSGLTEQQLHDLEAYVNSL